MAPYVLCRCCLAVIVLCCTALRAVDGFSLQIPQHQMHQVLPLGANATVHCLPEPNGSRPEISWTIDTTIPYETHLSYYNGMGIVVHLTADNISFVTVEGRQDNIIDGGRKFSCRATDKNNRPIASDTAIVEFYGPPTAPSALTVNITTPLSLLLWWQPSQGRNITYELTGSRTDAVNNDNADSSEDGVNIMLTATSHVFNVSSMERCKEYMFTVRAVNPAGNSNESDTITAVIPDGPAEIGGLQVTVHIADNSTSALITFSPTQCGQYLTNYSVRLVDQDNHTTSIPLDVASSSMSPVTAELKDLPADFSYTAVIIVKNAFGSSQSEPASIFTTEVQQAVILLSPDSSTANVTCHFAAGSTTSGCLVTIDRGTITNITIPREPGSLVAQGVIPLPPSPLGELVFAVYSYDSDGMMSDISGPVRVETSDQTTELPGAHSASSSTRPTTTTTSSTTSRATSPSPSATSATPSRQPTIDVQLILTIVVPVGVAVLLLVLVLLMVMILRQVHYCRKQQKLKHLPPSSPSAAGSDDTDNRSTDTGSADNSPNMFGVGVVQPYEVVPIRSSIHKPQDPIYQEIGANGGLTPLALLSPSPDHTSFTHSSSPPPLPPPYQPSPPTSPRPTTVARHSLPTPTTCYPMPGRDSFLPRSDSSGNSTEHSCSSQSTVTTPLTPGGDHLYFTLDQVVASTSQQNREAVSSVEYATVTPSSIRRATSADRNGSRRLRRTSDSALEVHTAAAAAHPPHTHHRLKKSASLKRTWV